MRIKVLVLGSTGLIGHKVFNYLNTLNKYDLYNISFRKKLNDKTIICDARNNEKFIKTIKSISPDIIINCIGILINGANLNPENAIYLNAYMPHMLMNLSDEINSKLIHISTDCVFSGEKNTPYNEFDYKDGKDTYAKTKGLGEIINDRHLTLRTSVIGPELKTNGEELFHWFMNQNKEINGFTKAIWSGVTTLVLSKVVNWAIEKNINGLYHVTNNNSIDKYSLLLLIKKYSRKDIIINPFEGKIINKSFIDTRKLIDYEIPSYDQMVKEMIDNIKFNKIIYTHYFKANKSL
jgi:dTDP-4-dehydrorhamnose reductase